MPDRDHAPRSSHVAVSHKHVDAPTVGKATLTTGAQPRSQSAYAPTFTSGEKKQTGLDALSKSVAKIEAIIATLSPKSLEKVLAPDAVIADTAQTLLAEIDRLNLALGSSDIEPTDATPHLQRLERAMGRLFTLGRQYHVPQRQSNLLYARGGMTSSFGLLAVDGDVMSGAERVLPQLTMTLDKIHGVEK